MGNPRGQTLRFAPLVIVPLVALLTALSACDDDGARSCSPCRPGTHASHPDEYCSTCVADDRDGAAADGDADATIDGASDTGAGCVAGAGFTACVHACGETDDQESTAATCVAGERYQCPSPLMPAIDCPSTAWPTGDFAGCGPWVTGYDCTTRALCSARLWTCPAP